MELMIELGILFIVAAITLLITRRTGIPAIPGLIISGIAIAYFQDVGGLSEMLVIGISFLVFYIGLRTDLEGFRRVSADSLSVSTVQISLVFFLAYALALQIGFTGTEAVYIGLASSLASTLAGTGIFDSSLRMDLHHGQISKASNFIQDLVAVIAIPLISGVTGGLTALLVLAGAFLFRQFLSRHFQRMVDTGELKAVAMVAVFALSTGLADILEISTVTTAFAAGLMLSKGSETEEFIDVLEPIKDFFAAVLFVGLGAMLHYPSYQVLKASAVIVGMALILRPVIISLVMLLDGHGARKAFKTSSSMLQVSEFALAAVILAYLTGSVSMFLLEALIISTALTMVVSAFAVRHVDAIYQRAKIPLKLLETGKLRPHSLEDHVVVVGYGHKGRKVVEYLEEAGKQFIVVDYNAENIERAEIEGLEYVFGDVLDDRTLEAACVDEAERVICTSDHRPVIEKMLELDTDKTLLVTREEASRIEDVDVIVEEDLVERGLLELLREES